MTSTNRPIRGAAPLAVAGGLLAALFAARRVQQGWRATEEETRCELPGDEILGPNADLVATRAIEIHAQPQDVWPWLVQIGQGRGGFYSYDGLQSLAGLDIHNAVEIEEDLQHLA